MPEIKGDYQGILKTIKCNADAKLETVSALEAGTAIIGNIDRVATVGQIDHLGSIGNTEFDQGAVSEHRRDMYAQMAGSFSPVEKDIAGIYTNPQMHYLTWSKGFQCSYYDELIVAPGYDGFSAVPLLTDTNYRLKTAPASERKGGVQTVNNAGTAVALIASSTPCIGVICKAEHENLGTVYVGDSTVDNTHGFKLRRDEFISFSADDVNDVYIDASRGTQSVSFLYINY